MVIGPIKTSILLFFTASKPESIVLYGYSLYLKSSLNDEIAYCHDDMGSDISIFFFGGYSSDMTGTKATALSKWCLENKYNFLKKTIIL